MFEIRIIHWQELEHVNCTGQLCTGKPVAQVNERDALPLFIRGHCYVPIRRDRNAIRFCLGRECDYFYQLAVIDHGNRAPVLDGDERTLTIWRGSNELRLQVIKVKSQCLPVLCQINKVMLPLKSGGGGQSRSRYH